MCGVPGEGDAQAESLVANSTSAGVSGHRPMGEKIWPRKNMRVTPTKLESQTSRCITRCQLLQNTKTFIKNTKNILSAKPDVGMGARGGGCLGGDAFGLALKLLTHFNSLTVLLCC